ncbi:tRNA glutamyl-Q(34) synthetase GluQRS [Xylophilus sp. GOD-11R]|uniref:tRNA glutamyl-Q(34) synthetase GluQRS n=1 Tax=Xylophilus sp. GOD-11R TaxID=3089814 RepID=UPI00298C134E|nr:tRNA glutamyl-Q(34) synthetase GluQRS [Xylophilus sp. GOD-11R]WPB55006.1 tRNA glutamyl-Q(34) synthetase GluQRS [Xylophilus sp. GOD-11R]
MTASGYVGRFAPSPTGALHAGSLVAALASWLDARAHGGRWLVRIEDVDTPRCVPGAAERILAQLEACAMRPDEAPVWQSTRGDHYQAALDRLLASGNAYPCACSRQDIARTQAERGIDRQRNAALPYPGTCRHGLHGRPARAWRLDTGRDPSPVRWTDRAAGPQSQAVEQEVGDFVLRRADGLWAYQLAVVVDDAAQGVTHVVRGLDLLDNTPRQIVLQRALGLPTPGYLHTPLVLAEGGEKLSKQNGATPFDERRPAPALREAAARLGLPDSTSGDDPAALLARWIEPWRKAWIAPFTIAR